MCKESCSSHLVTLLVIFFHFRSLCEAKIEVIQKNSKDIVYTIRDNYATTSSANYKLIPVENNKTYIIAADPIDACEKIKPPPEVDLVDTRKTSDTFKKGITWILLSRLVSGCNLEEMIQSASKLGYSSLILYGGFKDSSKVSKISPHGIPTLFISEKDGNLLREKYAYPKSYFLRISEPIPWYTPLIEIYNLAMPIIFTVLTHWIIQCFVYGLLLIIFFCRLLGYKFGFSVELRGIRMDVTFFSQSDSDYEDSRISSSDDISAPSWFMRNLGDEPMRDVDRVRLLNQLMLAREHQPRVIRLSTLEWHPEDEKEDTCAICLDHFTPNETLSSLPCNHFFHKGCIQTWLSSGRQMCPLCRHPVVTDRERMLEQLVRQYSSGLENQDQDWIQERHDRLRDTWYNLNW